MRSAPCANSVSRKASCLLAWLNAAAVRASSATWTRASISFEAPWVVDVTEGDPSYDKTEHTRITLKECVQEYKQSDVHHLPDVGNGPGFVYILRDRDWQGEE